MLSFTQCLSLDYGGIITEEEETVGVSESDTSCRKVRVGRDSYAQTGRAGDMSIRTGPTPRVEDESAYRQHTIDSPTFVRFCKNLPKVPDVGPHQRHHAAMQMQASAMQQLVTEDVMRLDAWDVKQLKKQAVAAAVQPAMPLGKKK